MSARRVWSAVALYTLLTALLTWPQVLRMSDGMYEHHDSYFNAWRVSWVAHQIRTDPARLFDANIFYAADATLAYSDAVLVPSLLGAPLRWAGVGPVTVTNVLILSSFVLSGMAAYLLAYALTQSWAGSILAGLVFAFSPYRFEHYMHLELLWGGFIPLALLVLHRAIEDPRLRWGTSLAAVVLLQTCSSLYYGIFLVTTLALLLPLLAWGIPRARWRPLLDVLAIGAGIAAIALLPYIRPYLENRTAVGERPESEAISYSATWTSFVTSPLSNLLYGGTSTWSGPEARLMPGFVALACALFALWPPLSRTRVAYAVVALFALEAARGAHGWVYPLMYDWVMPYRGLRAPARFTVVLLAAIGVLAAFGVARLEARLPRRARIAVLASLLCLAVLEYVNRPLPLMTVKRRPPGIYAWLRGQPPGPVAVLPMPTSAYELPAYDATYQYWSIDAWYPLINGYSGFYPLHYLLMLEHLVEFPDSRAIGRLSRQGARYLVVHTGLMRPGLAVQTIESLTARSDVTLIRVVNEGWGNGDFLFRLNPSPEHLRID
jgi:hypothetical protein